MPWNQAAQQAVIAGRPWPTVASRAYAITHTAIFEAWAACDPRAAGIAQGDVLQQAAGHADTSGCVTANTDRGSAGKIERWTPEYVPIDSDMPIRPQSFLTPHWGEVAPFALNSADALRPGAPEAFLAHGIDAVLGMAAGAPVLQKSKDLIGSVTNEDSVAQAEQIVSLSAALTVEQKAIAEFWEDGGGTSFPPGTWMTFGEYVSARDDNTLDQDAQMFFALGNAVFDTGIATWEAKTHCDYARPVGAIRDLGALGLLGEWGTDYLGNQGYVVEAYAGMGLGTQIILAENFLTYQRPMTDPSPPFAEYTSGHSSFSAAAAVVLTAFTGSEAFGASVAIETLMFEGIALDDPLIMEWATFRDAADAAGISRLYGGIHFSDGNQKGRLLGAEVGELVYAEAMSYVDGTADAFFFV